ncbi:hypothetical protein AAFC00_006333 [Neodothiora populina]
MGARAGTVTPAALSVLKLLVVGLVHTPLSYAAPILTGGFNVEKHNDGPEGKTPEDPSLYAYLGVAAALVLLGGAFAGLTIALMGQDEVYLQVIATSGDGSEKKSAGKVLRLLQRGKHWVLVTLLLSNVITNETLPIVLDRSLGGGWPAVLGSTVLIVIFGEIVPQSICVRYGLPIGAFMAPFVLGLMWIMAPVAWPTAKLLDWLLGEDHGTTYKKAGLKTLVTLHKTLGTVPGERLNEDEVTIITAVLDLKDKPVGAIMTPMQDVFTMSADTVLDEKMMDTILSQGYSRIPIYAPENPKNFIGMLLVKILITYDPEDALRVRDFSLATLPETAPDTSCLDIVNFFQEGKSHMVLVSDFPGQDKGALGVVTLEDVIEELIGEEIIDESDVFVDVHKAIRRMAPAPRTRYIKARSFVGSPEDHPTNNDENAPTETTRLLGSNNDRNGPINGPRETTVLVRRRSSAASTKDAMKPMPIRSNTADLRQHLKHLGPSNVASRPKATKYTSVKIKPGVSTIPERQVSKPQSVAETDRDQSTYSATANNTAPTDEAATGSGAGLGQVEDSGLNASDGAHVVANGYGTMRPWSQGVNDTNRDTPEDVPAEDSSSSPPKPMTAGEAAAFADQHTSPNPPAEGQDRQDRQDREDQAKEGREEPEFPEKIVVEGSTSRPVSGEGESRSGSAHSSTVGDLEPVLPRSRTSRSARSGSITENIINVGGMKKVVLETNNSSDADEIIRELAQSDGANDDDREPAQNGEGEAGSKGASKKKKKKKRAGKKFRNKDSKSGSGDSTPLLNHSGDD